MSRDPATLEREARRILAETRREFPRYKHALDRVTIRLSSRLTRSAGNADPRSGVVQLSEPIFRLEENAHGYRNTVLHEIAHVIAGPDVRAHGAEWRAIFIEIGGNGKRTHEFRAAGQHRSHEARCEQCGETVEMGSRRYNRLLGGARDYVHIGCGGVIVPPEGVVAPRARARRVSSRGSGGTGRRGDTSRTGSAIAAHCTRCGAEVPVGPIRWRRLVRGERSYRHRRCGGTIAPPTIAPPTIAPPTIGRGGAAVEGGLEQGDLFGESGAGGGA